MTDKKGVKLQLAPIYGAENPCAPQGGYSNRVKSNTSDAESRKSIYNNDE